MIFLGRAKRLLLPLKVENAAAAGRTNLLLAPQLAIVFGNELFLSELARMHGGPADLELCGISLKAALLRRSPQ